MEEIQKFSVVNPELSTSGSGLIPSLLPPTKKTIFNLSKTKLIVRSQENIGIVKEVLENERHQKPDQPGSS